MYNILLLLCISAMGVLCDECIKGVCHRGYSAHYYESGCQPVYKAGSCCPTSFSCQQSLTPKTENGKPMCIVGNKYYAANEDIPYDDPCTVSCRCVMHSQLTKPYVECVSVECPELFNDNMSGKHCSKTYQSDKCCSTGEICNGTSLQSEVASCEYGGKSYLQGNEMYLDDVCKRCICTSDFTGSDSASCEYINCGIPYHYNDEVNRGCSIIYTSKGKCCPIPEFICPDQVSLSDPVTITKPGRTSSTAVQCRFGDHTINMGDSLNLDDDRPDLDCTCLTPPQVTCVLGNTDHIHQDAARPESDPVPEPERNGKKKTKGKNRKGNGATSVSVWSTLLVTTSILCSILW